MAVGMLVCTKLCNIHDGMARSRGRMHDKHFVLTN